MSAKATFGTLKEKIYQGDYINRKKSKIIYCDNRLLCNKIAVSNSYEKIQLFNLGSYLRNCNRAIDTDELIISQYTKSDLTNVCTVSNGPPPTAQCSYDTPCDPCQDNTPVIIDTSTSVNPFYFDKTIDPLGELFGNTQFGELNYTKYMVPNTKDSNITPASVPYIITGGSYTKTSDNL
jgi:hypothetical protein